MRRLALPILIAALLVAGLMAGCDDENDDQPVSWRDAPVVPRMDEATREQFLADVAAADALGRSPEVFAKVGDSNTDLPANLYGFGCRNVDLGEHAELAPVLTRFTAIDMPLTGRPDCRPVNSFSRLSVATRSGSLTTFPSTRIDANLDSAGRAVIACSGEETPVDCEIRLTNARYTIIMSGTNDLVLDARLGKEVPGSDAANRLGALIERVRQAGSVPVLSNLPPAWVPQTPDIDEWGGIIESNERIQELADRERVPLINLWRALTEEGMIGMGLGPDGIHLSVYPDEGSPDVYSNSVVMTEEALRYGANRRNLIWLETLAELDREAADG